MNFLSTVCLARCTSSPLWTSLCCRDTAKITSSLSSHNESLRQKLEPGTKRGTVECVRARCKGGSLCLTTRPALWTQIRFNKGYPKFHRDIEVPNFDEYRKTQYIDIRKTKWGQGNEKVGFTYLVSWFGCVAVMYCVKTEATHFLSMMAPAKDVLAMAQIEVDISKVAPGGCMSLKWRGKPLFVKNRTEADITLEAATPLSALKDPQTVEDRTVKPEWLVVIGICTHLGCVPIPNSGDYSGGFYCPCHGSHYDNAGRARKGPAPTNLEVPPYQFTSDTLILVG